MSSTIPPLAESSLQALHTEAGIEEYRLDNGLKVLLVQNHGAPVVTVQVVYHVGSRNEAVGHTGATHFLEHMLFKGTPSFNKEKGTQIAQVLNKVGANFNATTWLDRTTYYETVPADQLDLALQIESERMHSAIIDDADRQAEMTVVRNEMERDESSPDSVMWKHLFAHAFLAHPYHHPTIGWHSDVEGMPTERLAAFYKEFYHPNNASLILVGDFETQSALAKIQQYFGVLPAGEAPIPPMYTQEFVQQGERRFTLRRPGQLGLVQMAWHVPPMEHSDTQALDVLQDILAEGVNSRLHQKVVDTEKALYAGAFNLQLRDPGLFIVHAKLAPDVDHETLEKALHEVIGEVQENLASASEIQRIKNQVHAQFSYQRHGARQLASLLAEYEAAASWRHMVRYLSGLNAVTAEDVQRVAQTYLQRDNLTVGWFVPGTPREVDVNQRPALAAEAPEAASAATPDPNTEANSQLQARDGEIYRKSFGDNAFFLAQINGLDDTVSVQGRIRAGIAFNPDKQPLAQLCASMLKKGCEAYSKSELDEALGQLGSSIDFQVGMDNLTFSVRCLQEHLSATLDILVAVLKQPSFPDDEFEKLKRQRVGRLKQRLDSPDAMAYDELYRALYPKDHYHYQDTVEDLIAATEATSLEAVKAFYDTYYGVESMTVAFVSALAPEPWRQRFANDYGQWNPRSHALKDYPEITPAATSARSIYPMPDKASVSVVMGHTSTLKRTDKDYYAAMLANHVLGQSSLSSRLGVKVRDDLGLTYGIYSFFADVNRFSGPWVLSVTTHPDNVEQAITASLAVVKETVSNGLTEQELEEAKSSLIGSYLVHLTTYPEIASRLLQIEQYQLGLDYFKTRAAALQKVTLADVKNALQKYIHPEAMHIALAGPVTETADANAHGSPAPKETE